MIGSDVFQQPVSMGRGDDNNGGKRSEMPPSPSKRIIDPWAGSCISMLLICKILDFTNMARGLLHSWVIIIQ
jgi:hypothetical protein